MSTTQIPRPTDYDLDYIRNEDGRLFYGKRIEAANYSFLDSVTGEKIRGCIRKLKKEFTSQTETNQSARIKKLRDFKRRKIRNPRAFLEYLRGEA